MKTDDDSKDRSSCGSRLREIRERLGLSQCQLADALSISQASVSHIENDRQNLSVSRLETLSRLFGTEAHWLVTGKGRRFTKGPKHSDEAPAQIPFVPIPAQAGYVDRNRASNFVESLERVHFPGASVDDDLCVFEVPDDSINPILGRGDFVLCRRIEDWKSLGDERFGVLVTEGRLTLREIESIDFKTLIGWLAEESAPSSSTDGRDANNSIFEFWAATGRMNTHVSDRTKLADRMERLEKTITKMEAQIDRWLAQAQ